jgi:hypothetical protein
MSDALLTVGAMVASLVVCLLFETVAKYRVTLAALQGEPTGRIKPAGRHIAVLAIAAFLGFRLGHHKTPYWSDVLFCVAIVVWWTLLSWDIGKEVSRQRMAKQRAGNGVA